MAGLSVPVGIHCHNDCELAVANSLAAVDAGAVQVQGTINGFGERCGNVDLISVIANLAVKKQGYEVLAPASIEHLTELSRFVYETANLRTPSNQPFVGQSAFAHKGGMHVHAIARATASYEHIDPQRVGNERRVLVSELSGRSNIKAVVSDTAIGRRSKTHGRKCWHASSSWRTRDTSSKRPKAHSICWSRSVPARTGRTSSG